MTREEFIGIGYSYEIEGDKIVVTSKGSVNLMVLPSLPPDVVFRNKGCVYLNSLTSLPPDVVFINGGSVYLNSLTSIPPGIVFNNGWDVNLDSLTGDWFSEWKGNIEGIDSKRLLNKMISLGLFER